MAISAIPKIKEIHFVPTLKDLAFEAIKNAILTRKIEPGSLIYEKELAEGLGISRTPVRESLLLLASRELITPLPQRGYRVNTLTKNDVKNLFELRVALETATIRHIGASSFSEPDTAHLLKRVSTDRQFHCGFAEMTRNRYIISALDRIWDHMEWILSASEHLKKPHKKQILQHRSILEKLKAHDVEDASSQMALHLYAQKEMVLAVLDLPEAETR